MRKKVFTLVELIITIAIIAILAVTAFLVITKWISKSRDSSRLQDIAVIQQGLETEIVNTKNYPMPDNYTGIYDTGNALARYQGEFTDNVKGLINTLNKTPKDPQGRNYGYSLSNDKKQYQLRAFLENTSYNFNYTDTANAATQISKINGNYNGFLVTRQSYSTGNVYNLWNIPTLFLWSGTVFTSGTNYISENNKVSDNTTSIKVADVSGLYDNSAGNDNQVLNQVVSTFSGINNTSNALVILKTSAGGANMPSLQGGGSPCAATTYIYNGHTYAVPALMDGQTWVGASNDVVVFSGTYTYTGTIICANGSFAGSSELPARIKNCGSCFYEQGGQCLPYSITSSYYGSSGVGGTITCQMYTDCSSSYHAYNPTENNCNDNYYFYLTTTAAGNVSYYMTNRCGSTNYYAPMCGSVACSACPKK